MTAPTLAADLAWLADQQATDAEERMIDAALRGELHTRAQRDGLHGAVGRAAREARRA